MLHDGAVLGGGAAGEPEWIGIVDGIVLAAPRKVNRVLKIWYAVALPVYLKAERLGLSRTTIYLHWKLGLRHVQRALGPKLRELS